MFPQKTFLTKKFDITDSFFHNGKLKLSQVMKCMEDVSRNHANQLGFGFDDMIAQGLLWMISKAKIVLKKPLVKGMAINLTTWPAVNRKFFCNRYFIAKDDNGEELFSAVYVWVVVDSSTRSMAQTDKIEQMYKGDFDSATPDMDLSFQKVVVNINDGWQFVGKQEMKVDYLDENNHVNNTFYMDFATQNEVNSVVQVEISYHRELMLGESVTIYKKTDGNKTQVCGIKDEEKTLSFVVNYLVAN